MTRVVTIRQVVELFECAYLRAATAEITVSGFKKRGFTLVIKTSFGTTTFFLVKQVLIRILRP